MRHRIETVAVVVVVALYLALLFAGAYGIFAMVFR